jgi:hypothetical protein
MLNPLERRAFLERFLNNQTDAEWARLRNAILDDIPVRVIVTIQGGNYQGAAATGPIDLGVLDYDNWEACGDDHQDEAEYYADLEAEVEKLKNDSGATLI